MSILKAWYRTAWLDGGGCSLQRSDSTAPLMPCIAFSPSVSGRKKTGAAAADDGDADAAPPKPEPLPGCVDLAANLIPGRHSLMQLHTGKALGHKFGRI